MERQGGACIKAGLGAIAAARENDFAIVTSNLQYLAEAIDAIITLLGRMYDANIYQTLTAAAPLTTVHPATQAALKEETATRGMVPLM